MPASLVDAFTRHQIYLEGYKDGQEKRFDPILLGLFTTITSALASMRVERLNELTRGQLFLLIRKINNIQNVPQAKFKREFIAEMRRLANTENTINTTIMGTIEGKTLEQARDETGLAGLLGWAALRKTDKGRKKLWANLKETVDPASGLKPLVLMDSYLASVRKNISQIITRGYANGDTVQTTINNIFGTKPKRFNDGYISKAKRQGVAAFRTIAQHISTRVQAGVASLFYRQYEWVAVLDNNTTAICRGRDGNIYTYGIGPLPPAHYQCRSRAVPVPNGSAYNSSPASFFGWLKAQPATFQRDIIGSRLSKRMRDGRLTAAQLGKFRSNRELTLKQFTDKINLMLTT